MRKDISNNIELVVKHSCLLGEGPVWDNQRNSIFWLDILNGQIHTFSTVTNEFTSLDVGQMIGCIAVVTNGNFIAGFKDGIGFIDQHTGKIDLITEPERHLPGNRFNDGKCDPAGRFWAGTMALSEESNAGNLYMVNHYQSIEKKRTGVTISNGLAWSLNGDTMFYIDTPTYKVMAFDFDLKSASITNERIVIEIPEKDGAPDGMTIDSEGMLWIAHWDGWQISRWNPQSGKKISQISLPVAKVTSCTFGGNHFRDLYITTAKVGLSQQELKEQPLAGSLFVIRDCGYQGMPANEFRL